MIAPFWTSVVIFVAFVINSWILLPIAKWGKLGSWPHKLMSSNLYLKKGTIYPFVDVALPNGRLNEIAYEIYGPAYMGLQNRWASFFDFASFASAFPSCSFGFPHIKNTGTKVVGCMRFPTFKSKSVRRTI